jgi:hydrogenase maturation protein HypF
MHGDLSTPEACMALEASIEALLAHAAAPVEAVAHDLHPDFHSTRVAASLAHRLGVPAIGVQHHAAHVGVVLAEQGLRQPVIGIVLDGFGLGDDGGAWGGELLWVHGARWRRVGHLSPLALPGGDRAAREPWRLAAAALHALGRGDEIEARLSPVVGEAAARGVHGLLQRGLNCPATSSAGRWFDAAAGALGLSVRQSHEAEAAIALEQLAAEACDEETEAFVPPLHEGVLDMRPALARLLAPEAKAQAARHARFFHHALADGLAQAAHEAACAADTGVVVLAGGCFLNRVLTARLQAQLHGRGLQTLMPRHGHCGDAGLALGQAWMAARQIEETASCA